MTGNHDGDGIGSVGQANRSGRLRITDTAGKLAVADGFSVRISHSLFHTASWNFVPAGEWEIEHFQFLRQVGAVV
jgi:hypothetical protein